MSLESYAERLRQLDTEITSVKEIQKTLNTEYDEVERKLLTALQEQNLQSFKCEWGSFSIVKRFSVKQPQTPEQWHDFWAYLQQIGAEEALKTVNSQRLNSWYKGELEAAKERGDFDFHPPGLPEPSVSEYISVRKV